MPTSDSLPRSFWLILACMLALALALGLDLSPWLRGGYGWRWAYDPAPFARVLLLIAVLVVTLAGGWLLRQVETLWPHVLWSLLAVVMISLAVTHAHQGDAFYTLFVRTLDVTSTGQHEAAANLDWAGGQWQDWSDYMRTMDGHIALSPPGSVLWYGLLNAGLGTLPELSHSLAAPLLRAQCDNYAFINYSDAEQASAWFGLLMPLWAGLTAIPLAGAARRLLGREWAGFALLLWPLTPTLTAFAGSWNTLYPLLALLAFWCILRALEPGRKGRGMALWSLASGVFSGLALFTNFAFVPLPGVIGFYVILHDWLPRADHRRSLRPVWLGLAFCLGLILPWLLFFIPTGQTPPDMLQAALDYHFDLDRPYWFWVGMHIWDWLMWAGFGFALLAGLAIWRWLRGYEQEPPTLALALFLTVGIIALSGTARGETARVWSFLAPLLLLAGLDGLRRLRVDVRGWWLLSAAHALLSLLILANIPTMGQPLQHPAPVPLPTATTRPAGVIFSASDPGEVFRLVGWEAVASENELELILQWQALRQMHEAYWFSTFLVGPEGTVTEAITWQPGQYSPTGTRYPTSCWPAAQVIEDRLTLPLPESARGEWWLSLAVFGDEAAPEGRLRVRLPDGLTDVQVGLGPVILPAN